MASKKILASTPAAGNESFSFNGESRYPVITCYPTDPRVQKLGGIETAVSGYLSKIAPQTPVKLVGVDARGDLKLNQWNRINWNNVFFDFFPLFAVKDLNRRTFPPLNARFILHLWAKKRRIFSGPAVLKLHRADHVLPFWGDRRFPMVLTIHGTSQHLRLPNESWMARIPPLYLLLERISLLRADKIFCVLEEGVRHYRKLLGSQKEKVALLENWIDFDLFSPQKPARCRAQFGLPLNKKILLFVGRLEKVKDPDLLLQTFREVKIARPDVLLALAGDGSEKEELIARHTDLKNDVIFLGTVPHARLPELLSASDCLLLTSHFEGMPRAVLEALATGVPVVSTMVGDVTKVVVAGQSGFVVPTRYAKDLAGCVLEILKNRPTRTDCRAPVLHLDIHSVLRKIETTHQQIAQSHYGKLA